MGEERIIVERGIGGNRWREKWPENAPDRIVVKRVRLLEEAPQSAGGDLWEIIEWSSLIS